MCTGGGGCGGHPGKPSRADAVAAIDRSFEFLGLPGSAGRFADVCDLKSRALQAIEKSDRARALGFADATADEHRAEALRYRALATRGLRSLRAVVAERINSAEWPDFVERLPASLPPGQEQPDLPAMMDDLLAESRRQLLDSALPAGDAAEVQAVVERAASTGRDGLSATMTLLVESLANLEEVLQRDTFGREPASPSTAEYIACTLAATVFLIGATVACGYIPFCWCCLFPVFLAVFRAWIDGCQRIPQ
jgi:hypothetical protein